MRHLARAVKMFDLIPRSRSQVCHSFVEIVVEKAVWRELASRGAAIIKEDTRVADAGKNSRFAPIFGVDFYPSLIRMAASTVERVGFNKTVAGPK
jgi:hypothetical protein